MSFMATPDPRYSREAAWKLLTEWTVSESLRKHALAVEACVAACGEAEADRLGLAGDDRSALVNLYATTALLHDFDYERHPTAEQHPFVGVRELEQQGWPQELRTAILGHAEYSGVPRESHLARSLYACDELAGFLTACALVKPSKSIAEVEVAGVRKKMKDKAFARAVHREAITRGPQNLGSIWTPTSLSASQPCSAGQPNSDYSNPLVYWNLIAKFAAPTHSS